MFFRIEKKILNAGSGVYNGVVTAFGLNNREFNEKVSLLFKGEINRAVSELTNTDIKSMECLAPYRDALKSFGINPSKISVLYRIHSYTDF